MIKITFEFGGDNVEVVIQDNNLFFYDVNSGTTTSIEGLRLSKSGCIKQFPDLKDNEDWREESIKRFKLKIKEMKTEKEKMEYIVSELTKQGYRGLFYQKAGYRPQKFRGE